jgi:hypothetical protein
MGERPVKKKASVVKLQPCNWEECYGDITTLAVEVVVKQFYNMLRLDIRGFLYQCARYEDTLQFGRTL